MFEAWECNNSSFLSFLGEQKPFFTIQINVRIFISKTCFFFFNLFSTFFPKIGWKIILLIGFLNIYTYSLQVPDYLEYIEHPMDFSTIRKKVDGHVYKTIDEFQADFELMIKNCLTYNAKDTVFYRAAVRLRDQVR